MYTCTRLMPRARPTLAATVGLLPRKRHMRCLMMFVCRCDRSPRPWPVPLLLPDPSCTHMYIKTFLSLMSIQQKPCLPLPGENFINIGPRSNLRPDLGSPSQGASLVEETFDLKPRSHRDLSKYPNPNPMPSANPNPRIGDFGKMTDFAFDSL